MINQRSMTVERFTRQIHQPPIYLYANKTDPKHWNSRKNRESYIFLEEKYRYTTKVTLDFVVSLI